ncbi:MAG: hypothetical protein P4M02_12255, partial [Clostridia bacterium]|nr:hypothetical protein [Clostridia bacterium]
SADTLCAMINHMVCDGTGFKEYLYLLAGLYTQCAGNTDYSTELACGPRDARQLFSRFSLTERLRIFFSDSGLSAQKDLMPYALQGDKANPFFVTLPVSREELTGAHTFAKAHGATLNDLFLTAYMRALSRVTGTGAVIIPCPVDLRKYLPQQHKHGICNLTGNLICSVKIAESEPFEQTLLNLSRQMKRQKASTDCLKPVMTLELACRLLPFRLLRRAFFKAFTIPVVSYTNLGIVDSEQLRFGDTGIDEVCLTGAVKYVPYFQIALSSFNGGSTLSCNLYGTRKDRADIAHFLAEVKQELLLH